MRYPGIIGCKVRPAAAFTDYAVDIYHYAVQQKPYARVFDRVTCLPISLLSARCRRAPPLEPRWRPPAEHISVRRVTTSRV
ncbi:MAG: hypothetical protein IPJ82_21090 [Lewinellaceae bacterium]|nr:hypothetical protein [Lewinellaceae bacterium]